MQWRIQGGSLGSVEPPFFVVLRAWVAGLVRTSAVENVLDSGTPFRNPRSATEIVTLG